jgi:hypothetical protein
MGYVLDMNTLYLIMDHPADSLRSVCRFESCPDY